MEFDPQSFHYYWNLLQCECIMYSEWILSQYQHSSGIGFILGEGGAGGLGWVDLNINIFWSFHFQFWFWQMENFSVLYVCVSVCVYVHCSMYKGGWYSEGRRDIEIPDIVMKVILVYILGEENERERERERERGSGDRIGQPGINWMPRFANI